MNRNVIETVIFEKQSPILLNTQIRNTCKGESKLRLRIDFYKRIRCDDLNYNWNCALTVSNTSQSMTHRIDQTVQ